MKAIVQDTYGSSDVLALRELDRPAIGANEVLLRVRAAGVDFGVWHLMAGIPYVMRLAFGLRRPKNPVRGLEVAGVIEAVGAEVTTLALGDEVFGVCDGAFAEYARASQDKVLQKPRNLTFEQAAAVPISATTALVALRAAQVAPGDKVAIIGAGGGVGTYAVQLARAMGAEVTGVCSTSKVELVRSLGAADVVDYTREDFATRGLRYDVILDIAGSRALSQVRGALTPLGRLILVGGEGGGRWFGLGRQAWALVLSLFTRQRLRSVLGLVNRADLGVLKRYLEDGAVTPVVDRRYPLSEVPVAVRVLAEGHSRGKAVISV
jgi:NADPH:quinone reductase-like Zn-dependent oxidoreductase